MLSDWDHKPIRTFLVKVLGQPPESALLEQDRLVIHVAAPPEPAHLCWREVPVPQHHMDVVAVISMAALDAHDVIKRSLVPPLGALHERAPRSADAGEVSQQMIVVIGQRVVCTLEAEQRKPKLQVVNGRSVYRKQCGYSQKDLASQLFVTQQAVGKWERGEATPNPETVLKIAKILGITTDQLLGDTATPASTGGTWVPVLGDVAAGIPIEAVENIVDYEEIDSSMASTGEFFGLRIKGSSMEPRIRDGDVVIVRRQEDAETSDTAVILVNGDSATVKRIKKEPDGSLWLLPNNPAYDPQHYSPAEIATLPVRIIGKVVELRGKF